MRTLFKHLAGEGIGGMCGVRIYRNDVFITGLLFQETHSIRVVFDILCDRSAAYILRLTGRVFLIRDRLAHLYLNFLWEKVTIPP